MKRKHIADSWRYSINPSPTDVRIQCDFCEQQLALVTNQPWIQIVRAVAMMRQFHFECAKRQIEIQSEKRKEKI